MRNVSPWLVLVLGLMVGLPAGRLVAPHQEKPDKPAPAATSAASAAAVPATSSAAQAPSGEAVSCKGTTAAPAPAWCEPVRLLGEFFGVPATRDRLADLMRAAGAGQYDLRFLVALVPAPPDPRLDQALEAVQRGFAQSGYLLDRVWLPWTGDGANRGGTAAQTAPGLLLFRGQQKGFRSLALVFLVGETPKAGIQKAAFREALDLTADLQGVAADPTVSLLGPSFSGSVESLRLALLSWQSEEKEHQQQRSLRFRAATGSVTAAAKYVEAPLAAVGVDVCRTVLPDETLHKQALRFLHEEMGWDLRRVALLTEADTAYGRNLLEGKSGSEAVVMVPFPSHISELRNAAERAKAKAAQSGTQPPIATGRQELELDLSDPGRPADLVPTFSPLTVLSNELMLDNLLQAVSHEGIRYVGILATDVRDKLFLAEEVRAQVPDAVLFTFDNDLLYAHSQYAQILDGMLVFSSAPLVTEGAPWVPASLPEAEGRVRLQFTSELQQGLYEAVRHLLGEPVGAPRAWIMAVGNGSLWPIASLKAQLPADNGARLCGAPVPGPRPAPPGKPAEGNSFANKDDLQVLLVAVVLAFFAWRLRRAALLSPVAGSSLDYEPGNRRLLALGTALLALAAGVLLAVGSLPYWARGFSLERLAVDWQPVQVLYLTALAFVYALLVGAAAWAVHRRLTLGQAAAWTVGTAAVLALLAAGLRWLCMPGGQVELFHLRARAFSSGLSPLVSLAAVGWAVYAWILWELKRRRLMTRQSTDCPVEALGDPAISGSTPVLQVIRDLLVHTVPADRRFWLLPAVAFIPPVLLLWSSVQPVAETQGYGRLFILFLVLALSLAALSYLRFFRLWIWTSRILHRLDNASPRVAEAFQAVAKDLEWRPIQSFGWQIPAFKTPTLSVRRLRALAAAGKVKLPAGTDLDAALKEIFENETDVGSPEEMAARNRLEAILTQVCLGLRGHLGDPELLQFVALRVAAWLRYIFAHMRSCLIGALAGGLLALVGVTAYAFEPRHFVSLAIWLSLAAAVGLTLVVFVQMDRNPTLSRIGDTTPGKVTFDRTFFAKLFTYVGLPILGLIATQFPEVGHLLGGLAGQLLRISGGG